MASRPLLSSASSLGLWRLLVAMTAGEDVRDLGIGDTSLDLMIEMELASGEFGRELECTERMEAGDEDPESRQTTSGESRDREPLLRALICDGLVGDMGAACGFCACIFLTWCDWGTEFLALCDLWRLGGGSLGLGPRESRAGGTRGELTEEGVTRGELTGVRDLEMWGGGGFETGGWDLEAGLCLLSL